MNNQIVLKSLKWKNLFSYGNQWNTFNFKTGVSFITGRNILTERRNFTGKSSFLKIIPFALFGKVEGLNKDQIINWKNKKQAEVILTFDKGESEYKVHRGLKPDVFTVFKDDVELPQSSNKKVFQAEIEESILGMDFDTFMNIVYCDTNNSVSILNASKPVKRTYIENLFNLSYFVKLKDIANAKKKILNDKVIETKATIESIKYAVDVSESNKSKYLDDKKQVIIGKLAAEGELKNMVIEGDKDDLNRKLNILKDRQKGIDKKLHDDGILVEKIKSKVFYLNKFKADEVSQDDIDDVNFLIEDNDVVLQDLSTRVKGIDIDQIDESISLIEGDIREQNNELQYTNTSIRSLTNDISKLEKELKSKPTEGICPTCMQKVDFNLIESTFKTLIEEMHLELSVQKKKLFKINEQIKNLNSELKSHLTDKTNYDELTRKLNENKDLQFSYNESLHKVTDSLKQYNKYKRYHKAIVKLSAASDKIKSDMSNITSFDKHIELVETKLQHITMKENEKLILKERIKSFDDKLASLDMYIKAADKQIKTDSDTVDAKTKSLTKINLAIEYLKQVVLLCSDDKAKQYAITSYLPYLNERINYYLNKSGVLFYVKLSGWLDYDIIGPGIKDCTYNNLSGAERISLDRSVQLASIDVKKQQASSLIDILILDEVLDSSLDQKGLMDMMGLIKAKQEDDQSKVLIVSHRSELGELDEMFDHKYIVEMDRYSNIKEG
jgi:DNA repair exonuclease SbcCD ATPase subunit